MNISFRNIKIYIIIKMKYNAFQLFVRLTLPLLRDIGIDKNQFKNTLDDIWNKMYEYEKKFYKENVKKLNKDMIDYDDILHNYLNKKLYKTIEDILDDIEIEKRKKECAICLEPLYEGSHGMRKNIECGHQFHQDCINKWKKMYKQRNMSTQYPCPLCRHETLQFGYSYYYD